MYLDFKTRFKLRENDRVLADGFRDVVINITFI